MSWMSAEAALALLGTKPQTLYANVSRGRIEARPDPADPRRSLYRRADIERLAERHRGRRRAGTVAAESMDWGEPVLPTALSTILGGRLFYRGRDAAALAETADLEAVASLLWAAPAVAFGAYGAERGGGPVDAFVALGRLAAEDLPSLGRAPAVLRGEAARVVAVLALALGAEPGAGPLHERLADGWGRPQAREAIRRALVLLAEHELNASTFSARVTASTGAALAAAVLSGLAALSGPRHGAASAAMQALAASALRLGVDGAIRQALAQGRPLPCFGHRLYPDGDIRVPALLAAFPLPPLFADLAASGEAAVGEKPNIDFALAAMARAFDLPPDAPLRLFALGRSVGWLAHALEQVESGRLIRPRAHYIGPPAERLDT